MITINSTIHIFVTPDTKVTDLTNPDSTNPNRLNAVLDWDYEPVKIMKGIHQYPDYIENWNTVQALVASNVLTISKTNEPVIVPVNEVKNQQKKVVRDEKVNK